MTTSVNPYPFNNTFHIYFRVAINRVLFKFCDILIPPSNPTQVFFYLVTLIIKMSKNRNLDVEGIRLHLNEESGINRAFYSDLEAIL